MYIFFLLTVSVVEEKGMNLISSWKIFHFK